MTAVTIKILWLSSLEQIEFDLATWQKSGIIYTKEYWVDQDRIVEYQVDSTYKRGAKKSHVLTLTYASENNKILPKEEISWGTSIIEINADFTMATAKWTSNPSNPDSNGSARKCVILKQGTLQILDIAAYRGISKYDEPIPHFVIGKIYNRKNDIHSPFGGNAQIRIAPSNVTDAIFLFTGDSGIQYGYNDKASFDEHDGSGFYTREGQDDDMQFALGNRAVFEHSKDGRALHMFQSLGRAKGQKYLGEFVYAGHRLEPCLEKDGKQHKLIIFELVRADNATLMANTDSQDDDTNTPPLNDLEYARRLAIAASTKTDSMTGQSAARTLYKRSKAVKDYVLMRAAGKCELCKNPAPFMRSNGTPYLEPHHTTRVSDGGPDHPRHVGAICPACHREIHHGMNGIKQNSRLQEHIFDIEDKAEAALAPE